MHEVLGEAELAVEVDRGMVVGLDVQHADGEALLGQPVEARKGEGPTQALAVRVRVDASKNRLMTVRPRSAVSFLIGSLASAQ